MAYAALASLVQTLEYLLQYPCMILEMKNMQAEVVKQKFTQVSLLLTGGPSTLSNTQLQQLSKEIETLASTAEDFFGAVQSDADILEMKKRILSSSCGTPKLLEEKPRILKDIRMFEADLKRFLDTTVFDIRTDISKYVLQQPSREAATKLLQAINQLKQAITFFYEVASEITILYQDLRSLLSSLDDSSDKFQDNELLNCSKDVACRTRDLVEEYLVDNQVESAMTYLIYSVSGIPTELPLEKLFLERVVKNIFDGKEGIRRGLVLALQEVRSIKIKTMNIGDKSLRLQGSSRRIAPLDSNENIVVGLDDELMNILERLTGLPSGLQIITVLGMGGIGKTTLARKAFNHSYTDYHFYCRAWITVSQVYQVKDLLLGLLSFLPHSTDKLVEKSNAELAEVVYRSLKGRRYLIVMDDMWSIDAWNDVKRCLPDDKMGSRILVTTRFTELAKNVNPKKAPHCMNLLNADQSWELLAKLIFGIGSCPPELVGSGKQIAKRCQGLPLAIVVIAGVLSRSMRTYDYWNDIAEKVSSIVSTDPEQCLDILALSYNYLPHHLKACFLYMGVFPEDCEIEVLKLINLWVAEGFIDSESSKGLEHIAENYLEDLIGRNLVLVEKKHFGGKVKTCRLHDFLRELCLREAQKENFMHVLQKRGSKGFQAGMRTQRRLSFHLDPYSDVPAAPAIPHVSSFLCFTLGTDIVPDILFFQLGFKLLRVLDIFFLHFDYFPVQIIKLIHLRYLALNVTYELPASISQLRNLQTFVIHGPWPCRESGSSPTLSLEYWSMLSLRHLSSSVASHLKNPSTVRENLPRPFASEQLQTLSTIRFSSCTKEVFTVMPHLKKLGISETKEDYSTGRSLEFLQNLVYLQELETLDCSFHMQNREARHVLGLAALPSTLRQLSLSWSYLPWEDMTSIAMLPKLEVLKLKNYAFQGPKWEPTEVGFRSLKHLLIENTDLVYWEATAHHFPCLQHIILKYCKHLEEIPFGVEEIGTLQRIEVHYCSQPMEISAKEIQEQIEGIDVYIRSDRNPGFA